MPLPVQVQAEAVLDRGTYLMRQSQGELDLIRYSLCVAPSLQRRANSCGTSSESCPSYTKRIHGVVVSSEGSIGDVRAD